MDWLAFREPFNSWTHGVWAVLAIPATILLWRLSRGDRPKQISLLVFGVSVFLCFGSSMFYHGVNLSASAIEWFATIDFIGVYLLIAGTVTPLSIVVLRGRWRWSILAVVTAITVAGIAMRLASVPLSRLQSTSIYLVLGWAAVFAYFEVARVLSHRAVWLAVLGGLLYTVGAMLNHWGWPTLWPGVFSSHEVWHLIVIVASLSHYLLMFKVIVPFKHPGADLTESLVIP